MFRTRETLVLRSTSNLMPTSSDLASADTFLDKHTARRLVEPEGGEKEKNVLTPSPKIDYRRPTPLQLLVLLLPRPIQCFLQGCKGSSEKWIRDRTAPSCMNRPLAPTTSIPTDQHWD